jgi:hypothetical protein
MERISLSPPRSLAYRLAEWYSRRKVGVKQDPGRALGNHTGVRRPYARYALAATRWQRVGDPQVQMAADGGDQSHDRS